jgi:phosphomannomutase
VEYAGIKFNPSDGGPADKNLTTLIEKYSNALMGENTSFKPAEPSVINARKIDAAKIFIEYINRNKIFNLNSIRDWLLKNAENLFLVVDFMHGSARGYIEKLLGDKVLKVLNNSNSVKLINTNNDYSFHGMKPEPNPQNQKKLIEVLQKNHRKFTLAVALDPDADRIRYADSEMDIDMNHFGAIAYAHLIQKGFKGAICSTLPSSDFALEIAKQEGQEVNETPVGFKFFREPLKSGKVLIAFEESDGISVRGHTLEKCALAGFILALDALSQQEKNLSEQYLNLQQRYGYYYPGKSGTEIKGVSVEEWQSYKGKVLRVLQEGLYQKGDIVKIGDTLKIIKEIITLDGVKLIFEDKCWILLRPSGTEPKFRYYYEIVSGTKIDNIMVKTAQYEAAAAEILNNARNLSGKA